MKSMASKLLLKITAGLSKTNEQFKKVVWSLFTNLSAIQSCFLLGSLVINRRI